MTLITNTYFFFFILSLLINAVFGIFILYSHRERKRIHHLLNEVKQSLAEKNRAISEQAAKLEEAYENLWKISQRLEKSVDNRSDTIALQHRRLVESFYFHTHKLRGHLANMMGLLQLAQSEDKSASLDKLLELMTECTRRFDETLRDFTRHLQDDM
jgi:hypothetical protein